VRFTCAAGLGAGAAAIHCGTSHLFASKLSVCSLRLLSTLFIDIFLSSDMGRVPALSCAVQFFQSTRAASNFLVLAQLAAAEALEI
jgi:hypothetical protein